MADKPQMQETQLETVQLTEQQEAARRKRNIAIAIALVAFVAIFYTATLTKFGPRLFDRHIESGKGYNQ